VLLSKHEGKLLGEPELVARGVLHEDVSEEVLEAAGKALRHFLEGMDKEWLTDMDAAKEEVRIFLRRWCKKHIGRRPMVLPIVLAL
jgi:ribonuclease J